MDLIEKCRQEKSVKYLPKTEQTLFIFAPSSDISVCVGSDNDQFQTLRHPMQEKVHMCHHNYLRWRLQLWRHMHVKSTELMDQLSHKFNMSLRNGENSLDEFLIVIIFHKCCF